MAGTRRKARTKALQALYEIDSVKRNPLEVVERLLSEDDFSEENRTFTRELVTGTIDNKAEIDNNIRKFAPAWPLEQLSIIDRNILRLGLIDSGLRSIQHSPPRSQLNS